MSVPSPLRETPVPAARPPAPGRLATRPSAGTVAAVLVLLALLVASLWSVAELRINVATFVDGAHQAVAFTRRTLPLDFPPVLEILRLCGQTLAIVILATLLSTILSVPLALLAASNTTPNNPSRLGARGLIVIARAVPDVVLAIVFVRIFGIGALTGVLAMGLHSIGMIGKMYADAIEQSTPDRPQHCAPPAPRGCSRSRAGCFPRCCRRSSRSGCTGSTSTCASPSCSGSSVYRASASPSRSRWQCSTSSAVSHCR